MHGDTSESVRDRLQQCRSRRVGPAELPDLEGIGGNLDRRRSLDGQFGGRNWRSGNQRRELPRANPHHLPGGIWHITHRCHQREFLLRFVRNRTSQRGKHPFPGSSGLRINRLRWSDPGAPPGAQHQIQTHRVLLEFLGILAAGPPRALISHGSRRSVISRAHRGSTFSGQVHRLVHPPPARRPASA